MITSELKAKVSLKPWAKAFIPLWFVLSCLRLPLWAPRFIFRIEVVAQ